MCTLKPKKVIPIKGETFFHVAFTKDRKNGTTTINGVYKPGDNKPGSKVGCLTIVTVKDSTGKLWSGITAFLNSGKDPYLNEANNIARIRLIRNIKRNINFISPEIYMGKNTKPIITEVPQIVHDIMAKRQATDLSQIRTI